MLAQLVEQLLRKPEIRGSNPVIGKFYLPITQKIEKMKIKKKRPGMTHLSKKFTKLPFNWS